MGDAKIPLLSSYLREALTLEELLLGWEGTSVSFGISFRQGEPIVVTKREPDVTQRAALLHHLRPFVLEEEPYSFYKTRNIVARSSDSAFLREWLKELKRKYAGEQIRSQMVMSSGEMIVNSEATLKRWLNGFEYHRDPEKARALEEALGPLPVDVSRPIFFMLLFQKADAIRHLGHMVAKMIGMPPAVQARDV